MFRQVTPEKVVQFTWFSVVLSFCWPPSIHSSRAKVLGFKVVQIISIVNDFINYLVFSYSIYCRLDDIIFVSKCFCLMTAMGETIVQTVICMFKRNSLQHAIDEMMICLQEANQYEREVFYKYTAKCCMFYGSSVIFIHTAGILFVLGPLFTVIDFPLEVEYPFEINYTLVKNIIYLHQSFLLFHCTSHFSLGIFGALLIWFSAARFECLAMEFKEALDVQTMIVCIKKQLSVRRYAVEVSKCFRFIVLHTIAISIIVLTISGIIIVTDVPLVVQFQYLTVTVSTLTSIYMYAWPADYMIHKSINVPQSMYESTWYEQTLTMQKNMLNIMVYQEPVALSVDAIMPQLSLSYYSTYLFKAISIFTTLRAILIDN